MLVTLEKFEVFGLKGMTITKATPNKYESWALCVLKLLDMLIYGSDFPAHAHK